MTKSPPRMARRFRISRLKASRQMPELRRASTLPGATAVVLCAWLAVHTRSLWAPYAAHQLGDMILDPLM